MFTILLKWIRNLMLLLLLCGAGLWILTARSAAGSEPDRTVVSLSPGHRSLIKLLQAPLVPRTQAVQAVKTGIRPGQVSADTGNKGPKRVYMAPGPEERVLLLNSLSRALRSRKVSPGGADLLLLQALNRLSGETAAGQPALAGAGDDMPESNTAETEPNDTWAQSQAIAYGAVVAGTSVPNEDLDVFVFTGQAGDFVRIDLTPGKERGWANALLFDPDSNLVTSGGYALKGAEESPDSRIMMPPFWGGGNVIGASLPVAGTYHILVQSFPGQIIYLEKTLDSSSETVTGNELTYTLTLQNLPTRQVSGRVIDDSRAAVAGAELYIWSSDGLGGVQAASDKEGAFSFSLPEGSYSVSLKSPAGSRYPDDQIFDWFKVTETGAALEYVLSSGVLFSGATMDDRGAVVPYVGFSLIDRKGGQYRWGSSDEAGNFSLAVFPGTYDIYLYSSYEYPPQPVIREVALLEDTQYKIVLDTGNRMEGLVLAPNGSPVPGVSLTFYGANNTRWAYSGEKGDYRVALTEDNYWINASMPWDVLLPDQQLGPVTVQGDLQYDIKLSAGGILRGTVLDSRGNLVQNANINLYAYFPSPPPQDGGVFVPEGGTGDSIIASDGDVVKPMPPVPSPSYYYYRSTDEKGRWQIAVLPGEYTVEVTAPWDYPYQQMKAGTFTVKEGEQIELPQVTIEAGLLFSGRVLMPGGHALAWGGFQIQPAQIETIGGGGDVKDGLIAMPDYYWNVRWVSTDQDGSFTVRMLPGVYNLYFSGYPGVDGFPGQTIANIAMDRDFEMTITLEQGYLLSGKAVDPAGRGIEGAYINLYDSQGWWSGGGSSAADGSYGVRLTKGEYTLMVNQTGEFFPDSTSYTVSITGDQSLDLVLRPGVRVYGRVTDKAGAGISGATVQLIPHTDKDSLIYVVPVEPGLASAPKGFRIVSPASAVGLVQEDIPEPAKADYNNEDRMDQGAGQNPTGNTEGDMPPPPGGPQTPLRDKTSILPGWYAQGYYFWTDGSGYWEGLVKAGVYDVWVNAYAEDKKYMETFLSAVDISAEKELSITLEEANVVMDGMVEGKDGAPVPGAQVSLLEPASGSHVSASTDQAGRFKLKLARGSYELYVGSAERRESVVETGLALSSDRELRIRLGEGLLDETAQSGQSQLPRAFALSQNSPNPFNPSTTISYALAESSAVRLAVFDLRGRKVATLVDRFQEQGSYNVQWEGKDSQGRALSSGVYFYRLEAGSFKMTRKMVLLK